MSALLRGIFVEAVAALDPEARVRAALAGRAWPRGVTVVAVGKAAAAMARGADGVPATRGLVVAPPGPPANGVRWPVRRASHPVPDAASEAAGRELLALAASVPADGLLVALVSGGASALAAVPAAGLALVDKVAATRAVYAAGAPIEELNAVRAALSGIKAGRLALACAAPVLTLVTSDVVGDDAAVVGSGPTVGPWTATETATGTGTETETETGTGTETGTEAETEAETGTGTETETGTGTETETGTEAGRHLPALTEALPQAPVSLPSLIARERDLASVAARILTARLGAIPPALAAVLAGPPRTDHWHVRPRALDRVRCIAGVADLARAAAAAASRRGVAATVWSVDLVGDVEDVARRAVRALDAAPRGPHLLVASGESTLVLPERPGQGGRARHLALLLARALAGRPGVSCLVAGSDGVDGTGPAAGAVVDGGTWARVAAAGLDGNAALAACDSGRVLAAIGADVLTGPTGVNHADLLLLHVA